jgi:hypothetical protein
MALPGHADQQAVRLTDSLQPSLQHMPHRHQGEPAVVWAPSHRTRGYCNGVAGCLPRSPGGFKVRVCHGRSDAAAAAGHERQLALPLCVR